MYKLKNKDGFSLVEVMFSVMIVTLGIITVMSLIAIVVKGNTQSKAITTASTIAQDLLEEFIMEDYAQVVDTDSVIDENPDGTVTINDIVYNWELGVQVGTPTVNSKTVTVDVYWGMLGGTNTTNNNVEMQTILSLE